GRGSDSGVQSCPRVVLNPTAAIAGQGCPASIWGPRRPVPGWARDAHPLRSRCRVGCDVGTDPFAVSDVDGGSRSHPPPVAHVAAVITPTERDAFGYVQMGVPRSKVHVVRTFVKVPEDSRAARATREPAAKPSASPILLFFGSFKYAPNREALEYIDRVLAPSLEDGGFHG